MSASNWAICPRCKRRAEEAQTEARENADLAFGVVSEEEYHRLREEAAKPVVLEHTFREDYEIYGAETGTVTVAYHGLCEKCRLALSFSHEHEIEGWEGAMAKLPWFRPEWDEYRPKGANDG